MDQDKNSKDIGGSQKRHLILLTTDLSSRGIDIPQVDWIVQFDPPQWSDSFVHRIGRTARAGQKGQSILFLNRPEEPYISYLRNKKVNIKEAVALKPSEELSQFKDVQKAIHENMMKDKDLIDKS